MKDLDELSRRLPAFTRRGPRRGVIALGDEQIEIELPRFGTVEARLATTDSDGAWTSIRRPGGPVPALVVPGTTLLDVRGVLVECTDPGLAAAWFDASIARALAAPLVTATFVLADDHVEVHGHGGDEARDLDELAASIACAAVIATRPARLAHDWLSATRHLDGRATADRWSLDAAFAVVVRRAGIDVVLDTVRALPGERSAEARLRTRARIDLPARFGSLTELCAGHGARVGALGPAALVRDQDHLAVVRDGLVLDRAALDSALDLLVAIAVAQRPSQAPGPYR